MIDNIKKNLDLNLNNSFYPKEQYTLSKLNESDEIDDLQLKNIKQADWFKTMEHYPKTVGQMKLLVSIVDKIGIFDNFDLVKTSEMNSNELNIIYAILRIMNKLFNIYLDYVVKNIFMDSLKDIFICSHLTYYDLFFDQLTQDTYHFVCSMIKLQYPDMNENIIKNKFNDYLKMTFQKTFYKNIIKKLEYTIDDIFYKENEKLFISIINDFISYTSDTLSETYETMKIFLKKLFDTNCSEEITNEIINALKKHINLKNLFQESCMEIDIYCEQKLDDEFELNSDDKISNNILTNNKELFDPVPTYNGYQIHNKNISPLNMDKFHPFVENNFIRTKKRNV